MSKHFFIGVDIGGTRIKAVIRSGETILKQKSILTNSLNSDKEKLIFSITKLISNLKDFVGVNNSQLLGIGVGLPGIFEKSGKIINLPNLQILNGVNLKKILGDEFACKVKIVNDAQLPFYYFNSSIEKNKFKGMNILFLTLGTGLGVSFCINGKLFTNKYGSCEFSHVKLFGSKIVEYYISKNNLLKNLDGSIKENVQYIDFKNYGDKLGKSISALHNIIGFDSIFLSGGITNYSKYFIDECFNSFEKNSYFPTCPIEPIKSKYEIGAIGASYLFEK